MAYRQGRYSNLITPLFCLVDLIIITSIISLFNINITNIYVFTAYISLSWLVISFKNHYYNVRRHTKVVQIFILLFRQTVLYALVLYAFIGFFKQPSISRLALGQYLLVVFVLLSFFKLLSFFLLKKYRSKLGGNRRNVIVIGDNEKVRQLIHIFKSRPEWK